jgi:DNA replication protein DnaC
MVTAKTQRWSPEEFLRTLLEAEITARGEYNARARMKAAAFPMIKTIAGCGVAASSIPQATCLLDRLLHHAVVVVTEGESFRMRQAWAKGGPNRQNQP